MLLLSQMRMESARHLAYFSSVSASHTSFLVIFMARDIKIASDESNLGLWLGFRQKAVHGSKKFCFEITIAPFLELEFLSLLKYIGLC